MESQLNINIADYIEHSSLNPNCTDEDVKTLCEEAQYFKFPSVCVYPNSVSHAVQLLHRTNISVCTVIGFPAGATTSSVKLYEAQEASDNGAKELNVMINLGELKSGNSKFIYDEISSICEITKKTIKVVLESNLLTNTEKNLAVEVCTDAGAKYIETNTGWFGGITKIDIEYLNKICAGKIGIKASGGIQTFKQASDLYELGAIRIGTSHCINIVRNQNK